MVNVACAVSQNLPVRASLEIQTHFSPKPAPRQKLSLFPTGKLGPGRGNVSYHREARTQAPSCNAPPPGGQVPLRLKPGISETK